MNNHRRQFIKTCAVTAATASISSPVLSAKKRPKVVVIGGGFAGATVAKYLRAWSKREIDVTLIDANKNHTSCVLSNLILNRRISLNELTLSYNSLSDFYGVKVINDRVTGISQGGSVVKLQSGGSIRCDRVVIATGIAFQPKGAVDFSMTPHAWIAGAQSMRLARQVGRLGAGDTFVMTVPKSPYRCPPGPYERACVVADILKRKGLAGKARVIVLDENPSIQAERHTFERAFSELYGDLIEYVPNAEIGWVDSSKKHIETSLGDYRADVLNYIPRQQAAGFIREAGLANGAGWAQVDPLTYQSKVGGWNRVHVIGDAQATGQPKSAHMANAQAKVCADAIIRIFEGLPVDKAERTSNVVTNSACYSPISYDEASWLTANFAYKDGAMKLVHIGEAENWSKENYKQMFGWASNLFTDSFI